MDSLADINILDTRMKLMVEILSVETLKQSNLCGRLNTGLAIEDKLRFTRIAKSYTKTLTLSP